MLQRFDPTPQQHAVVVSAAVDDQTKSLATQKTLNSRMTRLWQISLGVTDWCEVVSRLCWLMTLAVPCRGWKLPGLPMEVSGLLQEASIQRGSKALATEAKMNKREYAQALTYNEYGSLDLPLEIFAVLH